VPPKALQLTGLSTAALPPGRLASPDSADAVIARLRDRVTDRPIPGTTSIGGPEGRMPSGESYVTVDLEPGEYLIVCTIPDRACSSR
jgi:hypothetical protein